MAVELGKKFKELVILVAGLPGVPSESDDNLTVGPAGAERVNTVRESTQKSTDKVRDGMVCLRPRKVVFGR